MPKSAFTRGWQRQIAKRDFKIPDPPPQPPRCDYPGCNDWGSFGYGQPGVEGLGHPAFFHTCGKHRLPEEENEV
jgi:hypothetical protein